MQVISNPLNDRLLVIVCEHCHNLVGSSTSIANLRIAAKAHTCNCDEPVDTEIHTELPAKKPSGKCVSEGHIQLPAVNSWTS